MEFGVARAGHDKDTLPLSTAEILWDWALQGYVAISIAGMLWGQALQGYSPVGRCRNALRLLLVTAGILIEQCRDALRLGTAGIFGGWALQGYLVVGHCRDTLRLGTAGILGGWALQDTHWLGTAGLRCH